MWHLVSAACRFPRRLKASRCLRTPETPVIFSLPYVAPSGETEARDTMLSAQLLQFLSCSTRFRDLLREFPGIHPLHSAACQRLANRPERLGRGQASPRNCSSSIYHILGMQPQPHLTESSPFLFPAVKSHHLIMKLALQRQSRQPSASRRKHPGAVGRDAKGRGSRVCGPGFPSAASA